jgi:predicted CXXCH cytochrome family protein
MWPRNLAVLVAVLLLSVLPLAAQGNDDCYMCHQDPDLTGQRDGEEIQVFVDESAYASSVHAELDCVVCHQDLDGAELPHEEDLQPVECGFCHDEQASQHERSLHGQAHARGDEFAPTCADCHGRHDILPSSTPGSATSLMNIPLLCGRCHHEGSPVSETHDIPQDRILENYSLSIHGVGLFQKGLTVTAVCTSCHTSHLILPHTDPDSSIHEDRVAGTCMACHARIEEVHLQVIEGRLWEEEPHKIPACVDCHSPHKIRRVFYTAGAANKDCLECHGKPDLIGPDGEGGTRSLFVDEAAFAGAEHAGTACAQCHTDVTPALERSCETVIGPVDCGICHAQPVAEYQESVHGTLVAQGDPDAPACLDCHDQHATMGRRTPASPTFPRNVPALCARCHREGEKAARRIHSADQTEPGTDHIIESYTMSIHGKGLLKSGLLVTATCNDCHTTHGPLPPEDPRSSVNPVNVAATCGSCHHGIEEDFQASVHFPGNSDTDKELPTCEDCHSSHSIGRTDQGDFRFRMMDQCGRCHEAESETFFDTFHGKVSRLGSAAAAKCYDCHGTHGILPTSDPASALSRRNVVETCGKCHEGSHRRFAGYLTHATHHDPERYPWLFLSFWGMTALLVGTLSFALLHTLAWLVRLWLTRDQWQHKPPAPGEKLYRRFKPAQRNLHLVMIPSFFILALTGMTLKFSHMKWAALLSQALGGFDTMAILHRLGAVVLFVIFMMHVIQVRRRKVREGKTWFQIITGPDSMLFNLTDLKEAIGSIKWFFGMGPRPRYGRYTYWEKFDYFAVLWGVVIIGTTGLILWFPETFTYVIPGWFINVATIIHSDEALLAVAFIFTIHFFNTHFRPDKFPMDPVIFTGRMTLDELKRDKPREYEEMVASGELEQHMVDPIPESLERTLKIFGAVALMVGLTLIGLIIWAMLFGYN